MFTVFNQLPKEDYVTSSEMGIFLIRKDTTDFQFINFAYESAVKKYIERNLNEFEVFIDAGACIGEYDIWLAGFGKRCIVFEGVNFKAIQQNIALNRPASRNIDLYPIALNDMNTIDSLIKEKQFIIFSTESVLMKMNVKGREEEMIRGAAGFIENARNLAIIYEHSPKGRYRTERALSAIADFTFSDIDPLNRLAVKNLRIR